MPAAVVRGFGLIVRFTFPLVSLVLHVPNGDAAIISTGDVKPPFALVDTVGGTKIFTVPEGGTTGGGVYIGDLAAGRLDIDNGWELNSTFGVMANTSTSSTPSAAELSMSQQSTWNVSQDFEVGRAATAVANVSESSLLDVGWQTRLGSLSGSNGQLNLNGSTLTAGSLLVGAAGTGSLTAEQSTITAGFVEVGREETGLGTVLMNEGSLTSTGGLSVGIGGSGSLSAYSGASVSSLFANLGVDFSTSSGPSNLASSNGSATISGPGTTWQNTEGLGVGFNSQGNLTVEYGATLMTGYLEVARWGQNGYLYVNEGSVLIAQNDGFAGTPALLIGTEASAIGQATVFGSSASLLVGNDGFLEVARKSADAELSIGGGAVVSTPHAIIATEAGSVGGITLEDENSQLTVGGTLEVGRFGTGQLNVASGAGVEAVDVRIGLGGTSQLTEVLVDGPDSYVTASSQVVVGEEGEATLSVTGGAAVNAGSFLIVGNNAGGQGTLEISGAAADPAVASTVTSQAQILVGTAGLGTAVIEQGGRLVTHKAASPTASSGILAQFADSQGTVTVDGPDSSWTSDGAVNVGFRGTGALYVQAGAQAESTDGVIGRLPGSTGSVTLTGGGSAWIISDSLYVGGRPSSSVAGADGMAGPGGSATLSVGAGAYATVASRLEVFSEGTVDVSSGGSIGVGSSDALTASTLQVHSGGTLAGEGSIVGQMVNAGVVAPGFSAGELSIQGDYVQTDKGLLAIELGGVLAGAEYDQLDVTGDVTLDAGSGMSVSLLEGFSPQLGNQFQIISAGNVAGQFSQVVLPLLPAGLGWQLSYLPTTVQLSVVSGPAADFNGDGMVDSTDLSAWHAGFGTNSAASRSQGDADGDQDVDGADFLAWQRQLSAIPATTHALQVPEPAGMSLLVAIALLNVVINAWKRVGWAKVCAP